MSHEEWFNVPNKGFFNANEQMVAAYHKGTMVFAYKGYFNSYINYHWTGAFLSDPTKVLDKRAAHNGEAIMVLLMSQLLGSLPDK